MAHPGGRPRPFQPSSLYGLKGLLVLSIIAAPVAGATAPPHSQAFPAGQIDPISSLEPEPPRPSADSVIPPPHRAGPAPVLPGLPQVEVPTPMPWSKLVFESFRDGNWEIYLSKDDASSQTRLTYDLAVDIHPRLNRGATRIVFASERSGNYDIFTMNPDGSGLVQLTFDPADDVYPAWSPDGAKIAFQAYRDGQAEIYVMNADGSGQTRLTFNVDNTFGNAYDAQPAWSPDSARIAFISKRTGGYRVWVMNADGTGQVQLSQEAYSANPAWSPDGTTLAYDADSASTGWQDLWLMNADGTNRRQLWDTFPPNNANSLVSSWSPDGRYLVFTYVSYIFYGGTWYWTAAHPIALELATGFQYYTMVLGYDWAVDWQTIDTLAPESSVARLEPYSRAGSTTVSWAGSDSGGALIHSYDVQYRLGEAGLWTDWYTRTTAASADFSGAPGTTVYFRSRARDQAWNTEAWPAAASGDTATTLFTWQLSGAVEDAREQPVPNALVLSSGPLANAPLSDHAGQYAAYLEASGTHVFTATKTGYGAQPGLTTDVQADLSASFWLPPADNQVANGDFEAGSLAGWTASGPGTPSAQAAGAHSGLHGVQLGQTAPLVTPFLLSSQTGTNPSVAFDLNGSLHVTWNDAASIFYTNCSANAVCLPAQPIAPAGSSGASMAVGPDGQVHIVWAAEVEPSTDPVWYMRRSAAGTWTGPQIAVTATNAAATIPVIAVDPAGLAHVAWSNVAQVEAIHQLSGGGWTPIETVTDHTGLLDIAASVTGTVHLVFGAYGGIIGHTSYFPGLGWSPPTLLDLTNYADFPTLAVAPSGEVHVVWTSFVNFIARYARRSVDGTWSSPEDIPGTQAFGSRAQIALQADGTLVVASSSIDWQQLLTARRPDGTWSGSHIVYAPIQTAVSINVVAAHPTSTEVGLASRLNTLFTSTVVASRFEFQTEQPGASLLQQAVTVPASLHEPTLSLSYAYTTEDSSGQESLTLSIEDALGSTPLASVVTTTGWTHAWFDLSPWAGQTVTLTVGIDTIVDDLYSLAYVDDVSVGSWLTPVLESIAPDHIEERSSLPLTLTLTGDNFIATPTVYVGSTPLANVAWLDEHTLTATLPAGLALGRHTVRVLNPGGQESILTSGLRIGRFIFLPLAAG